MQLHHLKKGINRRKKKRIGRGGKRGTYSGRGQKGQKSRAGRRIRKSERDLILRLPKKRGFRNKPKTSKPLIVELKKLLSRVKTLTDNSSSEITVTLDFLKKVGLVPLGFRGRVKILGRGEVDHRVKFQDIVVSKNVKIISKP